MDKNIQARIKEMVDSLCRGNKSEFSRRIGKDNSAIKDIVGGKGSFPGYDLIYSILSSDLGISPNWLLLGEGEMLRREKADHSGKLLPLIPIEALAGHGTPAYDDLAVENFYSVADFGNSDFLIRVKGDSMSPKYCGGDVVACRVVKEAFFFQWGRVYVIYTESQGVMIKRVQPCEDRDFITCVSDNPKYAPFDVPKSDIVSIALVNGAITLE